MFHDWHKWCLALACILFSVASISTHLDRRAHRAFLETVEGSQVVFVTTASDCLQLVEDVERIAADLPVPVRILLVEDGVSEESVAALVAASPHPLETISWRSVSPFGRLVRTPFAIVFDIQANTLLIESVDGRADGVLLTEKLFRDTRNNSL